MEEGGVMTLTKPVLPRPKLVVPPRNSSEGFIHRGLNSATPTPMIFGSSSYGDRDPYTDCKPFPSILAEALGSPTFAPFSFFDNPVNNRTVKEGPTSDDDEKPVQTELLEMGEAHFDSQSISSARYKAMMPSRLPITSSLPHLTIPPGISPATLLESPILFTVHQTDPSPTTGTFCTPSSPLGINNASMVEDCSKIPKRNDSFVFKPHLFEENHGSPANISMGTFGMHAEKTAKHLDGQWQRHMKSKDLHIDDVLASDLTSRQVSSFSSGVLEPHKHLESMSMASADVMPMEFGPHISGITKQPNGRLCTDEYNWKKYGQKTLKNCENPRSYYKCTHPNCPAKKQVECSQEGQITEVMYKGKHNHAKPQGTRKRAKSGSLAVQNSTGSYHDRAVQESSSVSKLNRDKASGELSLSFARSHGGLPETPEFSFTSPSNEDDENGEASMVGDDGANEHHSKNRRIENEKEDSLRESVRTTREPRVVVQTVSQRDILDDGYRWRKYGQKVVKGHHYPRNYYKCTNIGCTVRKHVERSSLDAKCVMTTYEGKHNHSVPPARASVRETEEDDFASAASYPSSPAYVYSEGTYTF